MRTSVVIGLILSIATIAFAADNSSKSDFYIKTFCGHTFGEVKPPTVIGLAETKKLDKPFRFCDTITTEFDSQHKRLQRITLIGNVPDMSLESAKDEVEKIVSIFKEKYGIEFKVNRLGYYRNRIMGIDIVAIATDGGCRISVTVRISPGCIREDGSIRVDKVSTQKISIPAGVGADVL